MIMKGAQGYKGTDWVINVGFIVVFLVDSHHSLNKDQSS